MMTNLILSKTRGNKLSNKPSTTSVAITYLAQRMFVTDGQTDGRLFDHNRRNIAKQCSSIIVFIIGIFLSLKFTNSFRTNINTKFSQKISLYTKSGLPVSHWGLGNRAL